MFRRCMSLLLAAVMVFSMVPAQVFAQEPDPEQAVEETQRLLFR